MTSYLDNKDPLISKPLLDALKMMRVDNCRKTLGAKRACSGVLHRGWSHQGFLLQLEKCGGLHRIRSSSQCSV